MKEKEIDNAMIELATEGVSFNVYQYRTEWGIPVVYSVFDREKLDEDIRNPIYLTTEDVHRLNQTEDILFQKALENTAFFMRCQIISFSSYLEEFIPNETDCTRLMLMDRIVNRIEGLEHRKKLWCMTSAIRQRGACCCFYKPMLKVFCEVIECSRLLIGINNNDYAYLVEEKSCKPEAMQDFIYHTGHVIENQEKVLQKAVLVYDRESNSLKNYMEK